MIKKINEIRNIELVNRIFEFLKTTPILKSLFKEIEYDNYILKDGIQKLLILLKIIIKFLLKFLVYYFGLLILELTYQEYGVTFNTNSLIMVFSLLTLCYSISYHIINFDKNDFLLIKLLNIDREKYVKNKVLFFVFSECFYMFFILLIMGFGFLTSAFMTILNVSIKITYERYYLHRKKKARFNYIKSIYMRYLNTGLAWSVFMEINNIIIDIYEDISISGVFIYAPSVVIIIIALYLIYYLIKKYDYNYLFNKYLTVEMYNFSRVKLFAKSIDTEYTPRKSKVETEKKGFEYLYYLFNKRYAKSLMTKIVFFGGMFAFIIALSLFLEDEESENILMSLYAYMPLIYPMSIDYLRLCYTQLDAKLLNFNFYKKNIYAHMKYRFYGFIKYDLLFFAILYIPFFFFDPGIKMLINIIIYILVGVLFNTSYNYYFYFFVDNKNQDRLKLLNYSCYAKITIVIILGFLINNQMILLGIYFLIAFGFIYLCYKNVKGELKK